jgi:hypothetical protein
MRCPYFLNPKTEFLKFSNINGKGINMTSSRSVTKAVAFVLVSVAASASYAQAISPAKAAELTLHRIERLVILKKIDLDFQTKFQSLSVQAAATPVTTADAVAYISQTTQFAAADGQGNALTLNLTAAGKPLDFAVAQHGPALSFPTWADKDAVTLAEEAMHYLIDHVSVKPELKPFFDGFTDLTLSQTSQGSGQVTIHTTLANQALRVIIGADGNFQSATIE